MMLGFTLNQLAVLFLVLVLGWLLGLASRSGGAKWRRAYEAEAEARAEERRSHQAELSARDERIRALETRPAAAPIAAVPPVVTPATLDLRRNAAAQDDLSLIRGIGANGQDHLNDAGITRYRQIRDLTADEATSLESRIGAPAGQINRDQWREQAALLEDGKREEHRARFA